VPNSARGIASLISPNSSEHIEGKPSLSSSCHLMHSW